MRRTRMPKVDDYAGSRIRQKVDDSEETHVLAREAALGCGRRPCHGFSTFTMHDPHRQRGCRILQTFR